MSMNDGIVYLVGAGPGDPKLITLKGVEYIKKADVIVYDRLASSLLLKNSKPDAELIYVGKSPDRHAMSQKEINQLLVEKAKQGKIVVRLKGGDPFVFGRGGEEALELFNNNIPFEIIPGVTSAIAALSYAGIPVTHRTIASSFAVITGNEDPNKKDSSIQWDKIVTGLDTVVFVMGMNNLSDICKKMVGYGRKEETPVAVVEWGTTAKQRTITGNLSNIAKKVKEHGFKNPAVIVVGEVVSLREKLKWIEQKPLFGKKVLVTRSREQASDLSRRILELGGEPIEFPTIEIREPDDYSALDSAIYNIGDYKWIILTSVNGVKYFINRMLACGKDMRDLKGVNICTIGPKTKEALEKYAVRVDYVPCEYRAEQIFEGLKDKLKPEDKVLLPRADIARKALSEALSKIGVWADEVVVYKTVPVAKGAEKLVKMLKQREINILTFTSSSTVKNFVNLLKAQDINKLLESVVVASIGPVTSATAKELGINVDVEAKEYTIDGLVKAIAGN